MSALAIADAAIELGVRPGTLRRWIREGCPAVTRGSRGRGKSQLIDPDDVRRWRGADARDAFILQIAAEIPDLLVAATVKAHRLAEGVDKRKLAGIMVGVWYVATTTVLDRLRGSCPHVGEVGSLPKEIERLKKIAEHD